MRSDRTQRTIVFSNNKKAFDFLDDFLYSCVGFQVHSYIEIAPSLLLSSSIKKRQPISDDFLYNRGLPDTSIHSDRTQRKRKDAM